MVGEGRQSLNLLMNLSITKYGTTRHYVPYDVTQQKAHGIAYEIICQNTELESNQASRSSYSVPAS